MLPIPSSVTICQFAVRTAPRQVNSGDQFSGEGDALDGEQAVLDSQTTRVATYRGVGADYAVAGHDHRDGVSTEGIANRARRPRLADLARDARVGLEVAERHRGRRFEHCALKGGHFAPVEWNVEPRALTAEILVELRRGTPQDRLNLGGGVLDPLQPHRLYAALSLPHHEIRFR